MGAIGRSGLSFIIKFGATIYAFSYLLIRNKFTLNYSFSLVYLPIKAPTHEQNNLNNTNTTKHIYRVPVIIYNTSNTVFCVGDAMTHHEGQNNSYCPDHHNVP